MALFQSLAPYSLMVEFLAFGLFSLISPDLEAQEHLIKVHYLNVEDGLPDRRINSLVEDNENLIWIGTETGLCRYDGYDFEVFKESNSTLQSNRITSLIKDTLGLLWVFSESNNPSKPNYYGLFKKLNSLDIVNPETAEIQSFNTYFDSLTSPVRQEEVAFCADSPLGIQLTTKAGDIYIYNGQFHKLLDREISDPYELLIPVNRDIFWGFKGSKMYLFDRHGEILISDSLPGELIPRQTWIDKEKQLWILLMDKFTSGGFTLWSRRISGKLEIRTPELSEIKLNNEFGLKSPIIIQDFTPDLKWHKIFNSLFLLDSLGNSLFDNSWIPEYSGVNKNDIFMDSHDNLWVSTSDGIIIIKVKENPFSTFLNRNERPHFSTRDILSTGDGRLFVNSYLGTHLVNQDPLSRDVKKLDGHFGMGAWIDRGKYVWSAMSSFLNRRDIDFSRLVEFKSCSDKPPLRFQVLFRDSLTSRLWIGQGNGLAYLDEPGNCIEAFRDLNGFATLNDARVCTFYQNAEGIWIGTSEGLFLLDAEEGIIDHISTSSGLPFSFVRHIHEDDEGTFWLATNKGGLIEWDRKENLFQQYTTKDGLSHDVIHAVYEDDHNNLWMPSDFGLMRFEKETKEVEVFTTDDGLSDMEFNWLSHYRSDDGRLYFGGLNGINSFKPDELLPKRRQDLKIWLRSFDVLDHNSGKLRSVLPDFRKDGLIKLRPGNAYFIVNYGLSDLVNSEKNSFGYHIEGLDDDWHYTEDHELRIGGLPYGEYNIKIKGHGSGSGWTNEELSIPLIVLRPYYLTWQFIVVIGLSMIAIGFLIARWRIAYHKRRNLLLKEEVRSRTVELEEVNKAKNKLFAILAHDLRAPISSFKDLGKKTKFLIGLKDWQTLDKMGDQLDNKITRLDSLLSNLLPWVITQSRNPELNLKAVNILKVVEGCHKVFEVDIVNKNLQFENNIDKSVTVNADMPSVEIILRNIFSNAIKYSYPKGLITTSYKVQNGCIDIIVEDRGTGIDQPRLTELFSAYRSTPGTAGEKGHGLGLKLSRDLAISNNGNIEIFSEYRSGTRVVLTLPRS